MLDWNLLNNMNKRISIIIPVYNVEKYIAKCIQSLLSQTYDNFEAVLVNDGSPDNSIGVAKQLIGDDARFIFLDKKNGGQASARNLGLDHISGDYVAFLDSDDYLKNDFLEKILKEFGHNPALDIVACGYKQVDDHENTLWGIMPNAKGYYEHNDILFRYEYLDYSVCNKVYRRSVWENHRFIDGIIYEDKEVLPRLCYQKNIGVVEEYLYYYVRRQGSTMNSYNLQRSVESMAYVYRSFYEFLKSVKIYDDYKDYYQEAYIKYCFYQHLYMILAYSNSYEADCVYLAENINTNIINAQNINRYYGVFSKQFMMLIFFKNSPVFLKKILNLKLGLVRLFKRSK